jgi:hypothetical protein
MHDDELTLGWRHAAFHHDDLAWRGRRFSDDHHFARPGSLDHDMFRGRRGRGRAFDYGDTSFAAPRAFDDAAGEQGAADNEHGEFRQNGPGDRKKTG